MLLAEEFQIKLIWLSQKCIRKSDCVNSVWSSNPALDSGQAQINNYPGSYWNSLGYTKDNATAVQAGGVCWYTENGTHSIRGGSSTAHNPKNKVWRWQVNTMLVVDVSRLVRQEAILIWNVYNVDMFVENHIEHRLQITKPTEQVCLLLVHKEKLYLVWLVDQSR